MLIVKQEIAKVLGVSARTIERMVAEGRFPVYRVGSKSVRFDVDEVKSACRERKKDAMSKQKWSYRLIEAESVEHLNTIVAELLKDGWVPFGPAQVIWKIEANTGAMVGWLAYQTMTKIEEVDHERN